jgi:hypothetical protein
MSIRLEWWLELARRLMAAGKRPPLEGHIPHGPTLDGTPAAPVGPVPEDAPGLPCRWCGLSRREHTGAGEWCPVAADGARVRSWEPAV